MKTYIAALLCALATATASAQTERPQDRWNLADLYASAEAWDADAAKLETQLPQMAACKGQLGASARKMRECLDLRSDATKRYYRMVVFAYEQFSEDTGKPPSIAMRQKAQVLGAKFTEAISFMNPEILLIGRPKVDAFLKAEPGLAIYRHTLDDVLRTAAHTLDNAGEDILATLALARGQSGSVYEILANSDLPWPMVKLADGTEAKIDQSAYTRYRGVANRDDRKKVMDAFFSKWKEFENTMGVALYGNLKEDAAYAKVRKYPDSMTRALDGDNLPRQVYDSLIASTNANLPTLHRYFRLRAKMLGVAEMRYYDIYPPLVPSGRKYYIDEAVQMMLASVKPLGDDYVAAMKAGVDSRWMDVYPRPKKLSGAHMFGAAYDVHPYLMLNHNDNYESVSTLAHEFGHAMHSWFSNKAQPYPSADYATFVAEIASTTNELLLLDHVLKVAKDDNERLLYLGSALENLRATFFRQAMFAEFEQQVHAKVDKGEPLTGAQFTKIYGEILKRYHGDAEGVVKIDDLYAIEWAYISHFYRGFYVFQYSTSIAAGTQFGQAILDGKPGARERYRKLIASGSSDYPYNLVKAAGVDLASREPYDALARQMDKIMDEIEGILARKKG